MTKSEGNRFLPPSPISRMFRRRRVESSNSGQVICWQFPPPFSILRIASLSPPPLRRRSATRDTNTKSKIENKRDKGKRFDSS